MTQVLLLALAIGVFLHDDPELNIGAPKWDWWAVLAVVVLPKLVVAVIYVWQCQRVMRRLGRGSAGVALRRLGKLTSALSIVATLLYLLDLWIGALRLSRETVGDWVLVDELVVMLPTLGLLVFSWWAYYPIDRRLREVSTLRRADMGLPIYPLWTRGQYVTTQARNQMAMILGPVLLILAWAEALVFAADRGWVAGENLVWLQPIGVALVFITAPLLIRHLWDTVPLPPGPIRDRMTRMCEMHRVKVKNLLLWRTFGGMINAAVMGLFGPVRYILLTDGLLDQVEADRVEAVMAHELGHVRLKHLFTLVLIAAASAVTISAVGTAVSGWVWPNVATVSWWVELPMATGGVVAWVLMFGWASRRIERQADTFAARHMAEVSESPEHDENGRQIFDAPAVFAMTSALQRVADLNHVSPTRPSWRHGSIAWRQAYLRSLIGTPIDSAGVDRVMQRVNRAALIIVAGAIVAAVAQSYGWWV